ncbi:MAG: DUF5678 domain-containing protein [Candidatus Altiarchaeales archaeon]|nr:hypothetical protein [Candidatus Altiarchaeota archaeon]MCG2783345.1 DUF5678 domain-containing protein [Candidatus Altiarchaeales archaeon]
MSYFSDSITSPRIPLNGHSLGEEKYREWCREPETEWFLETIEVIHRKTLEPPWFMHLLQKESTVELMKPKIRDISQSTDSMASFEREKAAFLKMENDLLKKYKGNFVAVLGQKVVDSDRDMQVLMKRVYKKHGYVPAYMQKVGGRRTIRMPSPRIKRK